MRTKICGITSYEDAMMAIDAGANALGFVFYKESPRYINPSQAKEIIKKLPPFVEKVALFVNATAQEVNSTCKDIGATLAQIHFDADEVFYNELEVAHVKVIRAQKKEDILKYTDEYRLVDAYCEAYGGAGKQINTAWFEDVDCSKIILAGGLTPNNITALKKYGFYAFDVSSGVELSHGKKDKEKVQKFIQNAH
jgi:phosphoribosylanthranilate isomerase